METNPFQFQPRRAERYGLLSREESNQLATIAHRGDLTPAEVRTVRKFLAKAGPVAPVINGAIFHSRIKQDYGNPLSVADEKTCEDFNL